MADMPPAASDDRTLPSGKPAHRVAWQTWHGAVFICCVPVLALVPELAVWPLSLLTPLGLFAIVVLLIPSLRQVPDWVRLGRISWMICLAMAAIIVASSAVLVGYNQLFAPDLADLARQLATLHLPFVAGLLVFALVNALLEEVIFRGILHDAFLAQTGPLPALLIQAVVFGLGHARGYPPGPAGAVLAGIYGILLGILRQRTGGLAAPTFCHIFADATIFAIVAGH